MGLNSIKCPGYYQPFLAANHSTNKQTPRMRPSAGNPIDDIDVGGGAETGISGGGGTEKAPGGRGRHIDCAPGGTSQYAVLGYGYLILLKEKDGERWTPPYLDPAHVLLGLQPRNQCSSIHTRFQPDDG
jgi:hypothetical protein